MIGLPFEVVADPVCRSSTNDPVVVGISRATTRGKFWEEKLNYFPKFPFSFLPWATTRKDPHRDPFYAVLL